MKLSGVATAFSCALYCWYASLLLMAGDEEQLKVTLLVRQYCCDRVGQLGSLVQPVAVPGDTVDITG
jgi:hypothetical protein